ncbi:hypothetical protein [Sphingomonas hengshuiensis]|uniref:hypothetical protein n=1 Tax=Sphingomonas hengshuiensis TaxID=1609977 RepID=UPI000B1FF982|nr:hypothetical protein [Sphingomonas hengshuiensis]
MPGIEPLRRVQGKVDGAAVSGQRQVIVRAAGLVAQDIAPASLLPMQPADIADFS